jgi:hypothetical protein
VSAKPSPYDCKHFSWMPGMVSLPDEHGRTWRRVAWDPCMTLTMRCHSPGCQPVAAFVQEQGSRDPTIGVWTSALDPNWNDPGSWGCLLELLRRAYNDPGMTVGRSGSGWQVIASKAILPGAAIGPWPSDVVAMRMALESAP